jgi:4-amino-4-deoxy-L-arabinose transferase-like glycosyltransferase
MKFIKKNIFIILVLILGLSLRAYKYWEFPVAGETADEYAWTLLGASLIQDQQPSSWSFFGAYQDHIYYESLFNAPIVRPVLDHPPLFSLIPGTMHSLTGNWLRMPSIKVIRLPMIFLGVLNIYLLFLLTKKVFNRKIANIASLIYAVAPIFVFSSRLIVAENLLITWFLLSAILLLKSKINLKLLVLLCILAILTKLSGLILPAGLIIFGLLNKEKKVLKAGFWGLLVSLIILLIYASIYNLPLFLSVQFGQASRDLGLATLQNRFFLHPALATKIFFDGWIMLGLFSSFALILSNENKKLSFIKIIFILSLFFIVLTSGEQTFHGWYNYLIFPILSLSTAWLFSKIYETKNSLLASFSWLMLIPVIRIFLKNINLLPDLNTLVIRIIILLGLAPLGLKIINKERVAFKILFITLLTFAILAVFSINDVSYWETDQFFYYR